MASKQDWTIWIRNPQAFSRLNPYARAIEEAVEAVYKTLIDYQAAEGFGYHVVIVRRATQAMAERIALTIQTMHLQRMHETKNYSEHGWCSFELRQGRNVESIPEWVKALEDVWSRRTLQVEQVIPSEIIILQPRQEKREDAFWYSGEVARTEKYVLFAIEAVSCRFKEEGNPDGSDMFHDEEAREEARDRNLTDGDFVDHVHWYRNNWFEIRDMQNNQITDVTPETWTKGVNTLIDLISHDKEDKNDI